MTKEEIIEMVKTGMKEDVFLKAAFRDFKAAKALYHKEDVCNTIFHLQQCSEKLLKVFLGLIYDTVDKALAATGQSGISEEEKENDMKTHSATKILATFGKYYRKSFSALKIQGVDFTKDVFESAGISRVDRNEAAAIGEELRKGADRISRMDEVKILNLIKGTSDKSVKLKETKIGSLGYEQLEKKLSSMDRETRAVFEGDMKVKTEKYNIGEKEYFEAVIDGIKPLIYNAPRIFVFAMILFPHEQAVRYPVGNDIQLTPDNYIKLEVGVSKPEVINAFFGGFESIFQDLGVGE